MKGGFFIGFICPKCNNKDKRYFSFKKGEIYCRRCLTLVGDTANKSYEIKKGTYTLNYSLTNKQKEASEFIIRCIKDKKSCAVNAVCGAGKTEIVYELIKCCLNSKMKIGIAIPRKDVVIELKQRLENDFIDSKVTSVYGSNHDELEGDIIVFTTHQAYRYENYFEVLIVDEVDAFPFRENIVLKNILNKCSKLFVYLSATMPKYIEKDKSIEKYYLNRRYHNYDLPIPKCIECLFMIRCLKSCLKKYQNKVVLVYFPTISMQIKVAKRIKCDYLINSRSPDRENVLKRIKDLKKGVIFTTTILERGITINDVQVIVYNADHKLFDADTLIQIDGRVGRSKDYYKGDVVFICELKNKAIKQTIRRLKRYNE